MKFIADVCVVVFVLLGFAFGLKDPVCGLEPALDGNGEVNCEGYIVRYTYYAQFNSCLKFIFGGCGGNDNRFSNLEACEAKCKE